MPQLKANCVLCCGIVSNRKGSRVQAKALAEWKTSCVSSFSQVLELDSSACRILQCKTSFCPTCLLILRDIEFLLKSIDRFEKRLRALKTKAKFVLNNNVKRLGKDTSTYAKTVKSIFKSINGSKSRQSTSNLKFMPDEAHVDEAESTIHISTADRKYDIKEDATETDYWKERPKRTRLSRYSGHNERCTGEIEIKHEPESDCEEDGGGFPDSNDNDPDFDLENEESSQVNVKVLAKSENLTNTKPRRHRNRVPGSSRSRRGDGKIWCTVPNCAAYFLKPRALEAHRLGEHEGDPTPHHCLQCDLKFKALAPLQTHCENVHGIFSRKMHSCTECPRAFRCKRSLQLHISRYHTAAPVKPKCPVCTKAFENEDQLLNHTQLHDDRRLTDEPFNCVICSVNCVGIPELQAHIRKDHNEGSLKCPEPDCSKTFIASYSLIWHIKRCHRRILKPHLACPQCPYQAAAPGALRRHMFKHGDKLQFPCEREGCGKAFKYKTALNRHIAVVHDKTAKVFPCTLCSTICKSSGALNSHQAHHSSIRAFLCEHCSRGFKSLHNLRTHYKVHKAETQGRRVPALQKPRKARLPAVVQVQTELQQSTQHKNASSEEHQTAGNMSVKLDMSMDISEIEPYFQ